MFCHYCGAKLIDGARFCSKCGTRVPEEIFREMEAEEEPQAAFPKQAAHASESFMPPVPKVLPLPPASGRSGSAAYPAPRPPRRM